MLRPVRESARLGSPPEPFYTNEVESKNNILKQQVSYKHSELPVFVDHMKGLLRDQRREIERAVASSGEYRLSSQYTHLGVEQQKWFKMSEQQRLRKVERFFKAEVGPQAFLTTI